MLFSQIPAQTQLKIRLLKNLANKRIAHAQLFVGQDGYGALPLALAYAQYLNCHNPQPTDSCGVCNSCTKHQKLIFPDLHFTFPIITKPAKEEVCDDYLVEWRKAIVQNPFLDYHEWCGYLSAENKQGNINARECRNIIKKLTLTAYEGFYKVLILWKPNFLGKEANILLKLLEEPPENTVFLLVAETTENILPTIISRTQLVRIPPMLDDELLNFLQKKHPNTATETLETAILGAEGSYTNAKTMIANEADKDLELIFENWMRSCYTNKGVEISEFIEKTVAAGREKQKQLLQTGVLMLRRCFYYQAKPDSAEKSEFIRKFSVLVHKNNVNELVNQLNDTAKYIEGNVNAKLAWHTVSLEINVLLRSARP